MKKNGKWVIIKIEILINVVMTGIVLKDNQRSDYMTSLSGMNMNSVNTLFSSLSSGNSITSGSSTASMLSDYYSIRNGSYKKLLTAYYDKFGTDNQKTVSKSNSKTNYSSNSTSADSSKTLAAVKSDSDQLTNSAQALLKKGSASLFNKVTQTDKDGNTVTDYNRDKIYSSIKSFADNYNTMINSAEDINSSSILRSISGMVSTTKSNEKMLSQIGITINSDNTLSVNEDTVKSADIEKIKSLFNTTGSYGYYISAKASEINFNAGIEAGKANTYTSYGRYASTYSTGDLYNSLF